MKAVLGGCRSPVAGSLPSLRRGRDLAAAVQQYATQWTFQGKGLLHVGGEAKQGWGSCCASGNSCRLAIRP